VDAILKDEKLKKGVNVRSQNNTKEQLPIFKRWKGGSNMEVMLNGFLSTLMRQKVNGGYS
jgi:hypothetical protein